MRRENCSSTIAVRRSATRLSKKVTRGVTLARRYGTRSLVDHRVGSPIEAMPRRHQAYADDGEDHLAWHAMAQAQRICHRAEAKAADQQRQFPPMAHRPADERDHAETERQHQAHFMYRGVREYARRGSGKRYEQSRRRAMDEAKPRKPDRRAIQPTRCRCCSLSCHADSFAIAGERLQYII